MTDAVWSEERTTPEAVDAALRELVRERHTENAGLAPARALTMVAFVDREYSGEVANRLRGVGRYHASRMILLAYEPRREHLDAQVTVASEGEPRPGELALLHETVVVRLGARHMDDLLTVVDPLVVTDLPTLLWAPHGHKDAVELLTPLAQSVLVDSVHEPAWPDALDYAERIGERLYVVDLAWVRSTPWRERVAAAFAFPPRAAELHTIARVTVRHHPASTVTAMLFIGWLGSRLRWDVSPLVVHAGSSTTVRGSAHSRRQDVELCLEAIPHQEVPGLAGLTVETASGRSLSLDRGTGGLHAVERDPRGGTHNWTIVGASRGEGGILGEGIRQALLREPTYRAAVRTARAMTP